MLDGGAAGDLLQEPIAQGGLLVGGSWRGGADGSFPVSDPATGMELAQVGNATVEDAEAALDAAARAQESFSQQSPRYRSDLLRAAFETVMQREEEFATLITLEMGKPLAESRAEVRYAADYLRWFSEEAPRIGGESRVMPDGSSRMVTLPRPVGICVLITPWNFPLAMITRKLAPAIAAGCTSVVKPAEDTPLTTLAFAGLLGDIGVPDGVVNVLPTLDPQSVVRRLLTDGRARKLSFTGSTEVGRRLLATAADNIMRTSMELGGNAPFIVFDDADLEVAVEAAMLAKFRNGGQACTAANRFLVHHSLADDFTKGLVDRTSTLKIGAGINPDTTLGPMIHDVAVSRVTHLLEEAAESGAQVVLGGKALGREGSFFEPTVVTEVPETARLRTEEIFGPIVSLGTFHDEDEAIRRANATDYGLVAYAFTKDAERQHRLIQRLQYGMVAINRGVVSNAAAPFGGIKHSGLGREGSREGLREYLDHIYVSLDN